MMPSTQQHLKQADHNDALLDRLKHRDEHVPFSDWYVTISFYSAIHHFEAMLDRVKPRLSVNGDTGIVEHSERITKTYYTTSPHYVRDQLMAENQLFDCLYNEFAWLYKFSHIARYNCHDPNTFRWSIAKSYLDVVKRRCATLK